MAPNLTLPFFVCVACKYVVCCVSVWPLAILDELQKGLLGQPVLYLEMSGHLKRRKSIKPFPKEVVSVVLSCGFLVSQVPCVREKMLFSGAHSRWQLDITNSASVWWRCSILILASEADADLPGLRTD